MRVISMAWRSSTMASSISSRSSSRTPRWGSRTSRSSMMELDAIAVVKCTRAFWYRNRPTTSALRWETCRSSSSPSTRCSMTRTNSRKCTAAASSSWGTRWAPRWSSTFWGMRIRRFTSSEGRRDTVMARASFTRTARVVARKGTLSSASATRGTRSTTKDQLSGQWAMRANSSSSRAWVSSSSGRPMPTTRCSSASVGTSRCSHPPVGKGPSPTGTSLDRAGSKTDSMAPMLARRKQPPNTRILKRNGRRAAPVSFVGVCPPDRLRELVRPGRPRCR